MAELTMREAVALALAEEMERDERIVLLGQDVAAAGGVWQTSAGLLERFGPLRVRDAPVSESAVVGAAMGAALLGLRPVAEVTFSDLLACAWDQVANEIPKARSMSGGQLSLPLVIRAGNGAGLGFGPQHSQSVEAWTAQVPGLKTVSPSGPREAHGLLKAAIRDDDPVVFFEHKVLYAAKEEVVENGEPIPLGRARLAREGGDVTVVALAAMVPRALLAAARLATEGLELEVIDLRCLVPLDARAVLASVRRTGRLLTVEEAPRPYGWGAEIASIVADEAFFELDAPVRRVAGAPAPLPASSALEQAAVPSVDAIVEAARDLAAI